MRTRLQCLEMAAHCKRLAQNSASPPGQLMLMEAAKQWCHLADASDLDLPIDEQSIATLAAQNDEPIAWLLTQSGALIR